LQLVVVLHIYKVSCKFKLVERAKANQIVESETGYHVGWMITAKMTHWEVYMYALYGRATLELVE
jgi:hypothetical protein